MSWNPSYYTGSNDYVTSRDPSETFLFDPNGNGRNWSDIRKNAYYQLVLMQQQYERDEQWYNDYESYAAKYRQLRDLGVSGRGAMQHLLSLGTDADSNSSPVASGANQNSGFNAALDAMNGAAGNLNEALQVANQSQMVDSQIAVNDATAQNQLSEAANNRSFNPFVAPKAESEIGKNVADANSSNSEARYKTSLTEWTEEDLKRVAADTDLTREDIKLRQKQHFWYDSLTISQLQVNGTEAQKNIAAAEELWTRSAVNRNEINVQDALIGVYNSQELDNYQSAREHDARVSLINEQTNTQREITSGQQMDNVARAVDILPVLVGDLPYSAGDQAQMRQYLERGDFKSAQRLASSVWLFEMYAKNGQTVGEQIVAPTNVQNNSRGYAVGGDYGNNNIVRSIYHAGKALSPYLPFAMPKSISNPTYNNKYYLFGPLRRKSPTP